MTQIRTAVALSCLARLKAAAQNDPSLAVKYMSLERRLLTTLALAGRAKVRRFCAVEQPLWDCANCGEKWRSGYDDCPECRTPGEQLDDGGASTNLFEVAACGYKFVIPGGEPNDSALSPVAEVAAERVDEPDLYTVGTPADEDREQLVRLTCDEQMHLIEAAIEELGGRLARA